jgi:pyochelin biosynthetic protein PchC
VSTLTATLSVVEERTELSWLATDDAGRASVRLVCFPHAGGDPRTLLRWASQLPVAVHLVVVAPGEAAGALTDAAQAAAHRLADLPRLPTCLFGHSMGALLAYETARLLPPPGPAQLIVSGMEAPHRRTDHGHADLSDADLLRVLGEYGGTPTAVLGDEEFAAAYLARIRRDLRLLAAYRHRPGPLLRCPISVTVGRADGLLDLEAVRAWRELTLAVTKLAVVPGGHFFVQEAAGFVRQVADPLLDAATTW